MLLCSWLVDEKCLLVVVTFHVVLLNEHLDLLLDHLGVSPEHADVADDFCQQLHVLVRLLCFHDFDDVGLDNELTLTVDLLLLVILLCSGLCSLFLHVLLRDQIQSDRAILELRIWLNLFILTKDWLINLLEKDFYLRVAEFHHGRLELLVRDGSSLLDISARHLVVLIKEAQNGSLVHICDELILFGQIQRYHLDLTVRVQPCQSLVCVLVFEEQVKAILARSELLWKSARWVV